MARRSRRRDPDSLKVSRRSNALAFGPRHVFSASSPPSPPSRSHGHAGVLSQIDGNGPARPRSLANPNPAAGADAKRQNIRSLIPPETAAAGARRTREGGANVAARQKRRLSNASIATTKSAASSTRSRRRAQAPRPTLASLPTEILGAICAYLTQRELHAVMLASAALAEVAADAMYARPEFASTYRFAQFAHTVSHRRHYGERVRVLDVSGFTTVPQFERQPEAGWREWKFRSHDLYRANARLSTPVRRPSRRRVLHRSHPQPNPFLEAWALSRDIPLGGLCHAIQSCQNLT